ncbi:MAG: hypothetical protein CMJ85_07455 [Planctomycetes bacterium]|nr:hypothetical protein [Planctomycetota bacterium]
MDIAKAVEEIRLGASIHDLFRDFLASQLSVSTGELRRTLSDLTVERQRQLNDEALGFTGSLCRQLGERFDGDPRMCHVLLEWLRTHKDYEAFDVLLTSFDFPARLQVLAEGRRLFPATLTSHWRDGPQPGARY